MARLHFVFLILCKRLVWCIRAVCFLLYFNSARFLFSKKEVPPLPPAAHSFFEFPREKNQNGNGAAGAEGGNARYSARWDGIHSTSSNREVEEKVTTRAERAKISSSC